MEIINKHRSTLPAEEIMGPFVILQINIQHKKINNHESYFKLQDLTSHYDGNPFTLEC